MNWTNREYEPKKITIEELKLAVQNLCSALGEVDFEAAEKSLVEDALIEIGSRIKFGDRDDIIQEKLEAIEEALEKTSQSLKKEIKNTSGFARNQLKQDLANIMEGQDKNDKFIPRGGNPDDTRLSKVSQNLIEPALKYAAFKAEFYTLKTSINTFEEQSREK